MIIEFYIRFFVDMYRNIIDIYSIEKLIIYLKKRLYIYIYIHTHTHTHTDTDTATHIHSFIHSHAHIYTYTRSCSHTHSFTLKIHLVMYATVCVQNVCREKLYNEKNFKKKERNKSRGTLNMDLKWTILSFHAFFYSLRGFWDDFEQCCTYVDPVMYAQTSLEKNFVKTSIYIYMYMYIYIYICSVELISIDWKKCIKVYGKSVILFL